MPESRAALVRKARRSIAAEVASGRETTALWSAHDDGLAAWVVAAAPHTHVEHPPGDGGRYYLVVAGSITHVAAELARWSCVWAGPREERPRLIAGPAGAELVVVQFPRHAAAPGSP